MKKKVAIFGGGTTYPVGGHFNLASVSYGSTARRLEKLCRDYMPELETHLVLTKMADPNSNIETFNQLKAATAEWCTDERLKAVFYNPAVVDFKPDISVCSRLSSETSHDLKLLPTEKLISMFRGSSGFNKKHLFVVGFKACYGLKEEDVYKAGLKMLKSNQINLVLANDLQTGINMIITPEEAAYHVTTNRSEALANLVEMTELRSRLTFTQSTVVSANPEPWSSDRIPDNLRKVVEYLIERKAYKPFSGKTVGHFAVTLDDTNFLTSMRKTNFNNIHETGMVRIKTDGPDTVLAYGAKPSVGGQSQRIVFKDHPGFDCIVHFHCALRDRGPLDYPLPFQVVSQRAYECGSHECGKNTSTGLSTVGMLENIKMVMLDNHGPNIVFKKTTDPEQIISIINAYFDLDTKTGGYQLD